MFSYRSYTCYLRELHVFLHELHRFSYRSYIRFLKGVTHISLQELRTFFFTVVTHVFSQDLHTFFLKGVTLVFSKSYSRFLTDVSFSYKSYARFLTGVTHVFCSATYYSPGVSYLPGHTSCVPQETVLNIGCCLLKPQGKKRSTSLTRLELVGKPLWEITTYCYWRDFFSGPFGLYQIQ